MDLYSSFEYESSNLQYNEEKSYLDLQYEIAFLDYHSLSSNGEKGIVENIKDENHILRTNINNQNSENIIYLFISIICICIFFYLSYFDLVLIQEYWKYNETIEQTITIMP